MLRLMCVLLLLLSLFSPLTLSQQQTQPYHHQLPFGPPPLVPEFPPDTLAPAPQQMSNFEIKHQLDETFAKDPLFARSNLNVRVDSRRILLNGTVETEGQHQSAIRAAETYAGGRKIVDNIVVLGRT